MEERCGGREKDADGAMNLVWAGLIVLGVAAVAIAAMLLVRRGSPEGSYFEDGDRASGIFGVLATGFAVLIGFVVFLAFESFDTSRSGAEAEARIDGGASARLRSFCLSQCERGSRVISSAMRAR